MGGRRFRRRFRSDEIVRGQSDSRGHPEAGVQNTPDQARHARTIDVCSDAFRVGLAAGAEIGLIQSQSFRDHCASEESRLRSGYSSRIMLVEDNSKTREKAGCRAGGSLLHLQRSVAEFKLVSDRTSDLLLERLE